MVTKSGEKGGEPPAFGRVNFIVLVVCAIILSAVYIYIPFEPAVPVPDYSKGNILDHYPEMRHFVSLPSAQDQEIRIFDECAKKSHCKDLQKAFGIPDKGLSHEVRKTALDCCMAVVQHWYIRGSHPPERYPITWGGMINAWRSIKEEEFADQVHRSLQNLVNRV